MERGGRMKNEIYCSNFNIKSRQGVYTYNIPKIELNLCLKCERILRKQIINQDKLEAKIKSKSRKRKSKGRKN